MRMTPDMVAARLRALADAIEQLPAEVERIGAAGDSQMLILNLHFTQTPQGIVETIRREFAKAVTRDKNQLTLYFEE